VTSDRSNLRRSCDRRARFRTLLRSAPLHLTLIIALALTLRLYRIADYTAFQGDQGIDALAVKRLLVDHILPVEGPATSAGGVRLGPLYYYLLAIPMAVGGLDPLAAAVFMALLGAAATALLYLIARTWFGSTAALISATLFATSPAMIAASRSAWNPSPLPAFVLLTILALDRARRTCHGVWLLIAAVALASIIQFHYFSLALVLVLLVTSAAIGRSMRAWPVIAIAAAALLLAPFLFHEVTTDYPNLHAARSLMSSGATPQTDSLPRRLYAVQVPTLIGTFLTAGFEPLAIAIAVILLIALITGASRLRLPTALIAAPLVALLIQTALYRGPVFEHYLIAYAPLAFLALAAAIALTPRHPVARALTAAFTLVLLIANAIRLPYATPDHQLQRSEAVATHIIAAAPTRDPFGLWLLAEDDSDGAYRFQLERGGHLAAPVTQPVTRLFVICQRARCDEATVRASLSPDWSAAPITHRATTAGVELFLLVQAS